MSLPHWAYYTLLGLSLALIVGGIVARRRSYRACLVLQACGMFVLVVAMLTSSLRSMERTHERTYEAIAALSQPGITTESRREAKSDADMGLSDLREDVFSFGMSMLLLGFAGLCLFLTITKPEAMATATGRAALADEKARNALAAAPTQTGTPA